MGFIEFRIEATRRDNGEVETYTIRVPIAAIIFGAIGIIGIAACMLV